MATTKVELYNGATLVATKTSAPFTSIDWTPVTTGAATLTAKRYEDGVLVATSSVKNYTVDAAAGGAFDPSTISLETMWHKGDLATTDATATGGGISSSTDSLTTTPYNLTGSLSAGNQNGKECFDFGTLSLYLRATTIPTSFYHNTFSFFAQIKMLDGRPASAGTIFHTRNDATSANARLLVYINTSGTLAITYWAGGQSRVTTTTNPLFADGAMADFAALDIVFNNGGLINVYVDNVLQAVDNGDISHITMSSFTGNGDTVFGVREISGSRDLDFEGYMRNIIFQPVAHTSQNRIDLATL